MPLTGTAEQGSSRGELHGSHGSPVVAADGLALVVAWRYLGRHDDGPNYGFGGPVLSLALFLPPSPFSRPSPAGSSHLTCVLRLRVCS